MRLHVIGAACAIAASTGLIPLSAAALPAPVANVSLGNCATVVDGVLGDCQNQLLQVPGFRTRLGLATAGTDLASPLPAASAGATSLGNKYSGAGADLFYWFEWVGPNLPAGSLPMPMDVSLVVNANGGDANSSPSGDASVAILNPNAADRGPTSTGIRFGALGADVYCESFICTGNLNDTLHFMLTPNYAYQVEVFARASAGAVILGNAAQSADALADPRIYLDPTFANAGAYQLLLSDGIGNGLPLVGPPTPPPSGVPEPGTLALVIAGGSALMRRRPRG